MKKIALTVVLIGFATASVLAQTVAPPTDNTPVQTEPLSTLRMGLSAAPLISWFSPEGEGNSIEGDGVRFAIKYGLHMDFRLSGNENYFFSTGLFMVNTGGSLIHDNAVRPTEGADLVRTRRSVDYRINYLTVPLTFKLMTNEVGYIKYFARVGFDAGLTVHSRFDSEDRPLANSSTTFTRENANGSDLTRWYRFGLHIEAGLEYNLGANSNIAISLEWNNGLNNVFSRDNRLPTGTDANNNVALNGERATAAINFLALNLGIYF